MNVQVLPYGKQEVSLREVARNEARRLRLMDRIALRIEKARLDAMIFALDLRERMMYRSLSKLKRKRRALLDQRGMVGVKRCRPTSWVVEYR